MKRSDLYPSKYISCADLQGKDWPVTIARLALEDIATEKGKDRKPMLSFHGVQKGLLLNKTNYDSIAMQHGEETDDWPGKTITLYPDQTNFGTKIVDCVRIRTQTAAVAPEGEMPATANAKTGTVVELDDTVPF